MEQVRDGMLWAVSNSRFHNINRFDGKSWSTITPNEERWATPDEEHWAPVNTSIIETQDGTLWIGGLNLNAISGDEWRTYWSDNDLPDGFPIPFHRTRLLEASDGALWIAGLREQAVRIDLGSNRRLTYKGLMFQCETPDGIQWFRAQHEDVTEGYEDIVRHDPLTGQWTLYGVEDGVMDTPNTIFATRAGELWAGGGHDSISATARFDGQQWVRQMHPGLSWGMTPGVGLEDASGNLWFAPIRDWDVSLIPEVSECGKLFKAY